MHSKETIAHHEHTWKLETDRTCFFTFSLYGLYVHSVSSWMENRSFLLGLPVLGGLHSSVMSTYKIYLYFLKLIAFHGITLLCYYAKSSPLIRDEEGQIERLPLPAAIVL